MKPSDSMLAMALLLAGAVGLALGAVEAFRISPTAACVCLGFAGFLAGLLFAVFLEGDRMTASALLGYALGATITAGAGVILTREIGAGRAVVLLALAAATVVATIAAVRRITETGEPVGLESEWGGLGQGLGGWRLSASAALLLLAVVLGAMAIGVATVVPSTTRETAEKAAAPAADGWDELSSVGR